MQQKGIFRSLSGITMLLIVCLTVFMRCSNEEVAPSAPVVEELTVSTKITAAQASACGCTYTVPINTSYVAVDGKSLGIKPGAVVCLQGGNTQGSVVFRNLVGTAAQPITIKSCGGLSNHVVGAGGGFGISVEGSKFVHITGGTGTTRDIKVTGGQISVIIQALTTDIEMDHVEVGNSTYAGVMAKTDPSCTNNAERSKFVMQNVIFHDNYIHDTRSEGFYIGHSYWMQGVALSCGTKMPHEVEGVKVYNNIIKNSGAESIQIGSAPKGALVYGNRIENYGTYNESGQNNGIQFGQGANGQCYGNFIKGGKGMGIIIIGNYSNIVHDNVIVSSGGDGIFVDDRMPGAGFKFVNNTIINPGGNGITLYADEVTMNTVMNNIIVNPGSYTKMTNPRTGNDSYIYTLNKSVKLTSSNNYLTRDITTVKFAAPTTDNYALTTASTVALNKGALLTGLPITLDFLLKPRVIGLVDIGAYEFQ